MLDLRHVDGEVDVALGAFEPREAVRNIEQGLAVGAGKLHLAWIDPVGLYPWGWDQARTRARVRVRVRV